MFIKSKFSCVMLFVHVEQLGSHSLDLHNIYSGFFTESCLEESVLDKI